MAHPGVVFAAVNLVAGTAQVRALEGAFTPVALTSVVAETGYRAFRETDLHKLGFLGPARALGFSIEDCRNLLELYEDDGRASAEVRAISNGHLVEIVKKIEDLREIRNTLSDLIVACAGDDRPDCPILKSLASDNRTRDRSPYLHAGE